MTTSEVPSTEGITRPQVRALPWPVWTGIGIAGIAAAVGSWSALHGLAFATGWTYAAAHLFPASVDIASVSAGWVWLRAAVSPRARSYARTLTYGSAALSIVGNAVGHLVAEGVLDGDSWPLIVAVGAVPAVMLVALVHMAALLAEGTPAPARVDVPQPSPALAVEPSPSVALKPSPEAPKPTRPRQVKPSPRGNRQAIVLDILATSRTSEDVPQPSVIRDRWNVSQATAERARADALTALNTDARQEA